MTPFIKVWQVYSRNPRYILSKAIYSGRICKNGSVIRFSHTAVISKLTTYILFMFWLFFFFFGESLLLLTFNYSSLVDLISSASFFSVKHHFIFYIHSVSTSMMRSLEFYIFLLMVYSFIYLMLLFIKPNYRYFSNSSRLLRLVNISFIIFIL